MKKFLILLIAVIAVSACCVDNNTPLRTTSKIFMNGEPKVFTFNGHEYIYFYTSYGDIVHNPDCPCLNKSGYGNFSY